MPGRREFLAREIAGYFVILTFTEAFLFVPSVEVAVIVTVLPFPAFFVVTTPLAFTVAHFVFEDFHAKV